MANTFEIIDKAILGSDQASVTFSTIAGTYTDLCLKFSARSDANDTSNDLKVLLNGSTASVYSNLVLKGTGSSAFSQVQTNNSAPFIGIVVSNTATASTFGNGEFYFPNYTSSNAKSMSADAVSENNATAALATIGAYLWNPSTQAAITSIAISPYNGTVFRQHSSFYLYGIKNS
jgi:hypothetical protein